MKSILALAFVLTLSAAGQESRVLWVKGAAQVRLGDQVLVGVTGYEALRKASAERAKPITLWINGIDSEIEPDGVGQLVGDARAFTFRLTRTVANTDLWRDVLHDPFDGRLARIALSVGVSGDKPLLYAGGVTPLKQQKAFVAPEGVISAVVFLIVLVLLFRYKSDMLRNGPEIDGRKQAYSLGRSQMAWWFILILASYLTIWLITGDRDTITSSSLVLMGISAVTAMGAVAIDSTAPARANEVRKNLEAEKASLASSPTVVAPAPQSATAQQKAAADAIHLRVAEIDQTVANVTKPPMASGSWLRDVLTDNNGMVALHRFQILVWTGVLGVIFVTSVLRDLTMPEFNTTLLALMGISAGTYLGFKLPMNAG
jgi:predicted membrane channel-forming protein YqfA (hemolysin III family)